MTQKDFNEFDEIVEPIPKKRKYSIYDMDITFGEELSLEEAQRRFFDALSNAGVIGHRGGIC